MRRLVPEPAADVTVSGLMGEVRPFEEAGPDRPRVISNFVLTLDGRATFRGVSKELGSERDTEMLVGLRTRVDAVMIGAGTMRQELYGQVVRDPAKQEQRASEGLAPEPLMVLVSGRLDLPWDAPLFTCGAGEIVIFTTADADPPDTATPVEVVRHEGMVDLAKALAHLRSERGVRGLLCEGGPHLHAELVQGGLIDEMFVTRALKLAGGEGPGLFAGLPEAERPLELVWLVFEPETGELFSRFRVPQI